MRQVDRHPEAVHPRDRRAPEHREPAVARVAHAAAQLVGLAVGDADHPHAEPVEDVEPVQLVLDRRGSLDAGDQRDAPGLVRALDVGHAGAEEHRRLVRDVGQVHAEVEDHVLPFPAAGRRDRGGPVEEVLEDGVEARCGHALEAVELPPLPDVGVVVVRIQRQDPAVLVQRDADQIVEQTVGPRLLLGVQRHDRRGDTLQLFGELEGPVVLVRPQVGERGVAVPPLLRLHPPSLAAQAFPGSATSVSMSPWAAPDPDAPPPRPRKTKAAPTATAAPRSGPTT